LADRVFQLPHLRFSRPLWIINGHSAISASCLFFPQ
jgi:hypothetical protein